MTPAAAPIHEQIYDRFRIMIDEGRMHAGERVSSLRVLATELGVSRGTVQVAYDRLAAEGYLIAKGPAGTFVAKRVRTDARRRAGNTPAIEHSIPVRNPSELVIETDGGHPAPLQLGVPAIDEFPRKLWARLTARQGRTDGPLYKPAPAGHAPLREALANYVHRSRGIDARPDQVFIVPAYTAAIALVVDALQIVGDAWVESPSYPPTAQSLKRLGLNVFDMPVDESGLDVGFARRQCPDARLAVVTPSHQSPTGVTLPMQRRVELLDWAAQRKAWIIEDDYDGEFRYRGHALPALKSLDQTGTVIYIGTLSKVLFPGIRLSYLIVPSGVVPAFDFACRRTIHGGCPEFIQAVATDFINEGHFSRHIKRMRALYAQRRDMLATALAPLAVDGLAVRLQDGGMHLLVDVDEQLDDVKLATLAREAGLGIHALTAWRNGSPGRRGLVMGFTNVRSQAEADELVARLMRAWRLVRHVR